jgi:hypothetical protein
MLRLYINGPDDCTHIYSGQIFPEPSNHSIFNGGGGGLELLIRPTRMWTAQV